MIKPGNIRVFDSNLAMNDSFYNGGLNLKQLNFDPLITGYAVIIWDKVPSWVEKDYPGFRQFTQKNFKSLTGISDFELQTQAIQYGFGNNEYNVAGGITKSNTEFTLKHQEFSGSPVKNMYQHWVTNIADPETDIATYARLYGMDYAAKNHTGSLMYIVTRPDVNNVDKNNIEFAAYWTNVLPTKVPLSHFEYNQGDRNTVEIEIPFKGNMHISAAVDNYAKELLRSSYSYVTEGMFDPTNANQGGKNITVFENNSGATQQGLGDI